MEARRTILLLVLRCWEELWKRFTFGMCFCLQIFIDRSFHYLKVSLSVPEFWGQCLSACHACRQAAVTQLKRALSEYPPAFLPVLWQSSLNLLNGRHRKSGTVILPPLNLRLILKSVKVYVVLHCHFTFITDCLFNFLRFCEHPQPSCPTVCNDFRRPLTIVPKLKETWRRWWLRPGWSKAWNWVNRPPMQTLGQDRVVTDVIDVYRCDRVWWYFWYTL